jgi:Cdc6-like AAA superfamily ATPase
MDLKERIARRQRREDGAERFTDYRSISPSSHLDEPEDRGRVLEQLLDTLEPVFRGGLPADTYVHGPSGAGKTAVVRSLFDQMERHVGSASGRIVTSTRAGDAGVPSFVYLDGRDATSEFRLYRALLGALVDEEVPGGGVRTDELRDRLANTLSSPGCSAVVAVDHLGEPASMDLETLQSSFEPVADELAWLGVGTTPPDELPASQPRTLSMPAYDRHTLEDVLSARASRGLASNALGHGQLRRIASWADGDAHDALAALFGAATLAVDADTPGIRSTDIDAAIDAVPDDGVPVGLVLALPENRQTILRALIDLDERGAVDEIASAIAGHEGIDLSKGTVERFLYELADWGVLERVTLEGVATDKGRPPSGIEPRFPTLVFERLYDLSLDEE